MDNNNRPNVNNNGSQYIQATKPAAAPKAPKATKGGDLRCGK